MAISFQDLIELNSENVEKTCEEIRAAGLTVEEMVVIAHQLDRISTCLRQPSRTMSENFRQLVNSLVKVQKQSDYDPGWVYYRVIETWQNLKGLRVEDWQYLGKKLGYLPGWAINKFEEAQG
jgi:hypothetical protein